MANMEKTSKVRYWTCPVCMNELITHVNLSCDPVCTNPSSHTSKQIVMEQVKKLSKSF